MSRIGRSEISHGEILTVDEVLARTDAVTKEDAEGVARDVFSRPMALTVIGPFEGDAFDEDAAEGILPNGSSLEAAAHAEGRP